MTRKDKEDAGTSQGAAGGADETKQPANVLSEQDLQALLKKAGEKPPAEPPKPAKSDSAAPTGGSAGLDMLMDVALNVRIELGRARMSVGEILNLKGGSVVTLDKLAGDFVDVLVNDKLVARGEVLILNDRFCIRIAEIVSPQERQEASGV